MGEGWSWQTGKELTALVQVSEAGPCRSGEKWLKLGPMGFADGCGYERRPPVWTQAPGKLQTPLTRRASSGAIGQLTCEPSARPLQVMLGKRAGRVVRRGPGGRSGFGSHQASDGMVLEGAKGAWVDTQV